MKKSIISNPVLTKALLVLTAIALVSLLSGCGKDKGANDSGKIKIVAAENFYGEVAQAVGGDLVEVVSLLTGPDMDPHDFEPTPQASKDVNAAQVIIYNGIGYDAWINKIIDASGDVKNKTVIAVASDVMGKKEGDNEHQWYNPETFPKYAKDLAEKLGQIDPDHVATYTKQADAYMATLTPLIDLVKELRQATTVPIAVSEPIFDYMAEALNLNVIDKKFEMAAEKGIDPSPANVAQLQDDIKAKKIKMFVNNIQSSSPIIENMITLSKENGIPIIEVTETLPKDKTYIQWMMDILIQIKAALQS
ncbi:MAG: zinc ABC transporter substrate-binding protein [Paenibacillaceae bacterium]